MIPGILIDRDGVIIKYKRDYIRSWEDVAIFPQALRALQILNRSEYAIVIITNQSVIGRGLITQHKANEINQRLVAEIEKAGGRIDGLYLCPHAPDEGCECRKPRPGLILQAASDLDLDLDRSILIGDNLSDLQAGGNAGVARLALVRTGLGESFSTSPALENFPNSFVFKDLEEAVRALIPGAGEAGML